MGHIIDGVQCCGVVATIQSSPPALYDTPSTGVAQRVRDDRADFFAVADGCTAEADEYRWRTVVEEVE